MLRQITAMLLLYTAFRGGANYWQCDAWFYGTNAHLAQLFIFGELAIKASLLRPRVTQYAQ